MKLDYYHYIIEIARAGSINKAADNLRISQPHLSLALKELEAELAIKLLKRSHRGVTLTEAGQKFLEYAYDIQAIIHKTYALKNLMEGKRTSLSISSTYSFTMLDLYNNFVLINEDKLHDVFYEEGPNYLVPEKVSAGKADIGLIQMNSHNSTVQLMEFGTRNLSFIELCREPIHIIVNARHPLVRRESVTLSDLRPYRLLIEKIKQNPREPQQDNIPIPILFEGNDKEAVFFDNNRTLLYYLSKKNSCFSVGHKCLNLSNPFVRLGELKYIPLEEPNAMVIIGCIHASNLPLRPVQVEFISCLKEFFNNYMVTGEYDFL